MIKEFSWEREDDGSTLDTQETEQHELVYITNLKDRLQKDDMKLYDEEGQNNIKPAVENRLIEEPTQNSLILVNCTKNLVVILRMLKIL